MNNITDNNELIEYLIERLTRDGYSLNEIAKKLGIKKGELKAFIKERNGFEKKLEHTKLRTDYEVEDALLKRALGYTFQEVKEKENDKGIEVTKTIKDVPGDTKAMQIWLKTRHPKRWGDNAQDNSNTEDLLKRIFGSITQKAEKRNI